MASIIVNSKEAAKMLGVSCSTLYRGWPEGKFPGPIQVSEGRVGWLVDEIAEWQKARIEERDRNVGR